MTVLIGQAQNLLPGLKSGSLSAGSLTSLAAGFGSLTALARSRGATVEERNVPLPGG